jgi:hypothetical protein
MPYIHCYLALIIMEKELEKILKECMAYFGKENGYGKDNLSNLDGYVEEFLSDADIKKLCDRLKDTDG